MMEGQKEATTHAHTARSVGMRLPLFFSVERVGRRAHLVCVGSACALQSDGKYKKNRKGKENAELQKGRGERRAISWAGELRWRQSTAADVKGETREGVLFGFLGIAERESQSGATSNGA